MHPQQEPERQFPARVDSAVEIEMIARVDAIKEQTLFTSEECAERTIA